MVLDLTTTFIGGLSRDDLLWSRCYYATISTVKSKGLALEYRRSNVQTRLTPANSSQTNVTYRIPALAIRHIGEMRYLCLIYFKSFFQKSGVVKVYYPLWWDLLIMAKEYGERLCVTLVEGPHQISACWYDSGTVRNRCLFVGY